jgi:flagellar motor switch protein FliN/FliY
MPVHQVLILSGGAIVELDATEADEVKVLSNNLPIASGVVLVRCSRIAVEGRRNAAGVPGRPADRKTKTPPQNL